MSILSCLTAKAVQQGHVQMLRYICNFICRSRTPCGTIGKHIFIEISSRTIELVNSQRCYDNTRGNAIDAGHQTLFIKIFPGGGKGKLTILSFQQKKSQFSLQCLYLSGNI